MLISTEMKLYYDIVSGKYDKNAIVSLTIEKTHVAMALTKGDKGRKISFIISCTTK